jgi:hemolysin activation/secretion protein
MLIPLALLLSVTAQASQPEAGALLRDIEAAPTAAPGRDSLDRFDPTARPHGPRVLVRVVSVTGSTFFPPQQLSALFNDLVGREATWDELTQAAQQIISQYPATEGAYISVNVLPQTVHDGVVHIQVADAYLRSFETSAPEDVRFSPSRARAFLEAAQSGGDRLDIEGVERGLLLLGDLAGISISPEFKRGFVPDSANVLVRLENAPLVESLVRVDNHGNRYTGEQRLIGSLALNGPFSAGERFAFRGIFSSDLAYGSLSCDVPVGNRGLAAGLKGSWLGYRTERDEETLAARGEAVTGGVQLRYPLLRRRSSNLFVTAGAWNKRFSDEEDGLAAEKKTLSELIFGLDGDWYDDGFGGAHCVMSFKATGGKFSRSGGQSPEAERTDGSFKKLQLGVSRLQALRGDETSLYLSAAGQYAYDNLDSSEQVCIGGPDGVRAYPAGEGAGDLGALATVEARQELMDGYRVFGFYDVGWVRRERWERAGGQPNQYSLQGIGIGVTKEFPGELTLQATIAQRLGNNPGSDDEGRDVDGTKRQPRFWVQAAARF